MKTRYKKYTDYGMTNADVSATYDWLNACDERDKKAVAEVVSVLPPAVSVYVFQALTERRGYGYLCRAGLDYGKSDFYGYKRKGLFLVWKMLKAAK